MDSEDRIRIRLDSSEVTSYQKAEKKHEKGFSGVVILAVIVFCLFCFFMLFNLKYDEFLFDIPYIYGSISDNFSNVFNLLFGQAQDPGTVAWICELCAAMLAGAALASCGSVLQGTFRNNLAGPSTMGVMTGGTLGCLAYLLFFYDSDGSSLGVTIGAEDSFINQIFQSYGQQLIVFFGCILAVTLIMGIALAAGKGKVSASAMIISGTVFSAMIGNLVQVVQYFIIMSNPEDTRIDMISDMMLGNFSKVSNFRILALFALPIVVCIVLLLVVRNRLNLFSLGEQEATTMGMNVGRYRNMMIIVSTILTATVVSFCGRIGFLGFMIPLVGRKIAGPNMRYLIPACMLIGAGLMLIIFNVAHFCNMDDSLNVFTSSIGCIVMVFTLIGRKGGKPGAAFQGRGMAGMGMRF